MKSKSRETEKSRKTRCLRAWRGFSRVVLLRLQTAKGGSFNTWLLRNSRGGGIVSRPIQSRLTFSAVQRFRPPDRQRCTGRDGSYPPSSRSLLCHPRCNRPGADQVRERLV